MERLIKFRAVDTLGNLVYGIPNTSSTLHLTLDSMAQYFTEQRLYGRQNVTIKPETVGQFTGSVDRKGNEIYEGDIVLLEEGFYPRKRPIVFSEYGAWYIGELGISFAQMKADGFVNCEVIGNVHQNPELLESSAKDDA